MIKVIVEYHYTREINHESTFAQMTFEVLEFDDAYDMLNKLHEIWDDAGYTITHVGISEEVIVSE